jgi:CubicO group peptidase (beta-lactamase class C family)
MAPSQRSKARAAITGSWAAAALSCCAAAAAAAPELARMERAVELRVSAGQFMGSVLVARNGRVLLSKGYGEADLDGSPIGLRSGSLPHSLRASPDPTSSRAAK